MSSLVVLKEQTHGLVLLGKRRGFVRDSLRVWASALEKSERTIKRYAQAGLLPAAYKTPGGQWRAPFSEKALADVRKKLIGHARSWNRRVSADLIREWPTANEDEACLLTVAYALYLAHRRERLVEANLIRFYQRALFLSDPKASDDLQKELDGLPEWNSCRDLVQRNGLRKSALLAATAHAAIEVRAESLDEARSLAEKDRFKPFGNLARAALSLAAKRRFKMRNRGDHAAQISSRVRKQVIREAQSAVPTHSVIQKWQWIMMRRSVKCAPTQVCHDGSETRDEYVRQEKRHYCARTFFNWYSVEDRACAKRGAF